MDILSFIIGLAGIAVAGLSVWLTYKEKTSLYREKLYTKQMDVYPEVIRSFVLLDQAMVHMVVSSSVFRYFHAEDDANRLLDDQNKAQKQWNAFRDIYQCNLPVLSRDFADRIQQYIYWAGEAFNVVDAVKSNQEPKDNSSERLGLRAEILQTARRDLGTDPLTREALNLFGEINVKKSQK